MACQGDQWLLLATAMQRAEAVNELGSPRDPTTRRQEKPSKESWHCLLVVGMVEYRHHNHLVADIEIRVTPGIQTHPVPQAQASGVPRLAISPHGTREGLEGSPVLPEHVVIDIGRIILNSTDYGRGIDEPGDVVDVSIRIITSDTLASQSTWTRADREGCPGISPRSRDGFQVLVSAGIAPTLARTGTVDVDQYHLPGRCPAQTGRCRCSLIAAGPRRPALGYRTCHPTR